MGVLVLEVIKNLEQDTRSFVRDMCLLVQVS